MKLLTDFCVSQPIQLLGMTTEDIFVFNTHIYSSQEFLFHFAYAAPLSHISTESRYRVLNRLF